MRKSFLFLSLLLFMIQGVYGQIDQSIPTPLDLQHNDIKIVSKQKLPDGTIEIRYVDKKGHMIKRKTFPSKPGEPSKIEEWDETTEAERKSTPKDMVGGAAVSGSNEVKAGGAVGGSQKPPEGSAGDTTKAQKQGASALKGVKEGAEGVGKETAQPVKEGTPKANGASPEQGVKNSPGVGADTGTKVNATAKGTGNTIGVIANITVRNPHDIPVEIVPQTFFIPSEGHYQSYVGRIPPGITIPPKGTVDVPVNGVCADVRTPPVPPGVDMPPTSIWIPVDVSPPPGASDPPSTVPVPVNPPSGSDPPDVVTVISIITTVPVPKFNPTDIPRITTTSGFKPVDTPESDIIITWPGTDIPVGGTLDPVADPKTFATVIVSILETIEDAADIVQKSGTFPTVFARDSLKEKNALIQQTFWMASAALTGKEYTKADFTKNTYDQFQHTTGKTVASLPAEQKDQVDSGIADFWNTFQVTGVVAKVISADSPGIDVEIPNSLIQAAEANVADHDNDDVADPEGAEEESPYKCVCPDTIKFNLEVHRGETEVLNQPNTNLVSQKKQLSPNKFEVKVDKLKFGDILVVKATGIDGDCQCAQTSCDVTALFYHESTGNNNSEEMDGKIKGESFKMKIKAKNKKDQSIRCAFFIALDCTAEGCISCECFYSIELTFVASKGK